MDRWKTKKFRRKPLEIIATSFDMSAQGMINLEDFPIEITAVCTDKFNTDAVLGPLPIYEISWTDGDGSSGKRTELIPHNTVFIARQYSNVGGFYLTFMGYDEFFYEYDPVE